MQKLHLGYLRYYIQITLRSYAGVPWKLYEFYGGSATQGLFREVTPNHREPNGKRKWNMKWKLELFQRDCFKQ